jgi:hypothetical protein
MFFGAVFYVGMFISILIHAEASLAAQSNGLSSRRQWFAHNWVSLISRAFLATLLLPLMLKAIPSSVSESLPQVSLYGIVGIASDSLLSPLIFTLGQKLGVKLIAPEMPQVVPPTNPPQEKP